MSLRVRLILAFVALSVVPLGAMTWYTYSSNTQALKDAAEHESDMLAGELSQRMQLITTQLSERVEHLMDLDSEMSAATAAAVRAPAPANASSDVPVAPAPDSAAATATPVQPSATLASAQEAAAKAAMEAQVADRLGDAAMLLNNVELRGLTSTPSGRGGFARGGSGRRGQGGSRGSAGADGSTSTRGGRPPIPGRDGSPAASSGGARRDQPPQFPRPRPPAAAASPGNRALPPAPGAASPTRAVGAQPPPDQPSGPSVPPSADSGASNDRIRIDLSAIRRQMFREIAPDKPIQEMDAAERARVIAEVNQRLLGIQQGLRLGAAELQKQAEEAKRESETPKPSAGTASTTKPAVGSAAVAPTVAKKPALTGNRLNVRSEKNGVVRQASAEVNLPDLLSMVFGATPRDRGEVPFAIDKDGHIYTQTPEDRKRVESLGVGVASPEGKLGATRLPTWIVRTTADPSGSGFTFGIARPTAEAINEIRKTAARSAGLGLLFISLTLVGIVPLSAGLTRNLSRLSAGVHRIAGGDYSARVSVKTQDEIGQLAQAFNQMAGDVERHQRMTIGQERIKRELELGRQIQNDMLPHEPLLVDRTEVRGVSKAAGEVGGDFFNYFRLANGHVALLVGDVSGKGVGAALLMANIQASLRTRLALGQSLTALADELDRDIQANTPGPVYSTLFVGTLDPSSRLLRYVNAGHNPQYVLRRQGGLDRLESSGLPVGLLAGRGYAEGQLQLEPGDVVFCYTDGCVEAENEAGDMFSAEALERELLAAVPQSAEDLLRHMEAIFQTFRGTREPFDDATMMVVKVG